MKEKFWDKFLGSFDETVKGFSAKKLSAFTIIFCVVAAHGAWLKYAFLKDDFTLLPEIIMIDYGFVLTCFGLKTFERVKTGKNEPNSVSEQT